MKAQDIMTHDVIMVEENLSVAEAIDKMVAKKVSSLIVDRLGENDSYGIVTRRDVVNKVIATGQDPLKVTLAEIMTKPVLTIYPTLPIRHIARLMVQTGLRRIPVFDGHQIIGIVSNSDVFRGFSKFLHNETEYLD
ncbi:MAG: CBS domain-containing protein [Candidatus Schekmanbacteria bacterium]|nr:CBS domain-containing protein [Candidatus Schekmanbacteria bacterium]